MAEVVWTDPALAQLEAIAEFIALDRPAAAAAVVQRIMAVTSRVEQFRKMGRQIPEFRRPNYRQIWLKPCWVYYRLDGERVYILHVRRAERPLRATDLSGPAR